jgi:hypothetical protein
MELGPAHAFDRPVESADLRAIGDATMDVPRAALEAPFAPSIEHPTPYPEGMKA